MSQAINNLAIDFARANSQDQRWLRDEIKELRLIISALIERSKDKELRIPTKYLNMLGNDDPLFFSMINKFDRCLILYRE